jgi:hypothetical protein
MTTSTPTDTRSDGARRVLQEGLVAGLLGGVLVIAVFTLGDLLFGELLRTPSVLGTLLFEGAEQARAAQPDLQVAIAYNGIHVLVWLVAGVAAAYLVQRVERAPRSWYLIFVGVVFVLTALLLLDATVLDTGLGRLQLWLGGIVGVAAMSAFLLWRHPTLRAHVGDVWKD